MKNKILSLFIIFILIVFVSCNGHNDYKTIILTTTGYVSASPDEAEITLRLDCINPDIELAKNCLIKKGNELNEKLSKFNIDNKDILTTRLNLSKEYQWKDNSNILIGYKASITTFVRIKNLNMLDKLYSELLTNTNLTIEQLTYQHSKIDSLNEIAYLNALANAENLANRILDQIKEKNKEIIKISNTKISESENNYSVSIDANDPSFLKKNNSELRINFGNMVAERQIYVQFRIY